MDDNVPHGNGIILTKDGKHKSVIFDKGDIVGKIKQKKHSYPVKQEQFKELKSDRSQV